MANISGRETPSLKLYFGPDSGHLSLLTSAIDSMISTAGLAGVRARQNVTIDNFFVDQLP